MSAVWSARCAWLPGLAARWQGAQASPGVPPAWLQLLQDPGLLVQAGWAGQLPSAPPDVPADERAAGLAGPGGLRAASADGQRGWPGRRPADAAAAPPQAARAAAGWPDKDAATTAPASWPHANALHVGAAARPAPAGPGAAARPAGSVGPQLAPPVGRDQAGRPTVTGRPAGSSAAGMPAATGTALLDRQSAWTAPNAVPGASRPATPAVAAAPLPARAPAGVAAGIPVGPPPVEPTRLVDGAAGLGRLLSLVPRAVAAAGPVAPGSAALAASPPAAPAPGTTGTAPPWAAIQPPPSVADTDAILQALVQRLHLDYLRHYGSAG